jgi:hypothetical protein
MDRTRLDLLHYFMDRLYGLPGCSAGGPLHIVTDDGNAHDSDLEFCREAANDNEKWSETVRDVAVKILDTLTPFTEAQREDALNEWWDKRLYAHQA